MSSIVVLGVIAIAQVAFLVVLIMFLLIRRQADRSRQAAFMRGTAGLRGPMGAWLAGAGDIAPVLDALRALPPGTRTGHTSYLSRTALSLEKRNELATSLREEPWVRRAIARGRSRRWGRRLEAARALALAGSVADREQAVALLDDPRPAIAFAAVAALPRVADTALVADVLDRYPALPAVVRLYVNATLREMRPAIEAALVPRLVADAPPVALTAWIELAGELDLGRALQRLDALQSHAEASVRKAVAHSLRRIPRADTQATLERLVRDPDATVRGEAARSLGALGSAATIPALLGAAHDTHWEVRYQVSLALSQLGQPGRAALRKLCADPDRYVADVATVISGLSDGALTELVEI